MTLQTSIVLNGVSKFYGEVLGVNRVDLRLEPGITGLVGPNGAGKSTLMNLIAGLLRPTRGTLSVLGLTADQPELFYRQLGYCTQFDTFPPAVTGRQFIDDTLRMHGFDSATCRQLSDQALTAVDLHEAADKAVAGYSKGMRQRIKLAQAIAHEPGVLILDEPLNGLDPMARADVLALMRDLANEGAHVLVSSHILHEIDLVSDALVLLNQGYIVADGEVQDLEREATQRPQAAPMEVSIQTPQAAELAARLFGLSHVQAVRRVPNNAGLVVVTDHADQFFLDLNELVVVERWQIEGVGQTSDGVAGVYQSLLAEADAPAAGDA